MSTQQSQNEAIHQWNNPHGLSLFENHDAKHIRESCEQLLCKINSENYPEGFKEGLIDWFIWKYTECEFVFSSHGKYPTKHNGDKLHWGDKYAARHYSVEAWKHLNEIRCKSAIKNLRLDHVFERQHLRVLILENGLSRKIKDMLIGCVVTNEEHQALLTKVEGWSRYDGKCVFEFCDETKAFRKRKVVDGKLS